MLQSVGQRVICIVKVEIQSPRPYIFYLNRLNYTVGQKHLYTKLKWILMHLYCNFNSNVISVGKKEGTCKVKFSFQQTSSKLGYIKKKKIISGRSISVYSISDFHLEKYKQTKTTALFLLVLLFSIIEKMWWDDGADNVSCHCLFFNFLILPFQWRYLMVIPCLTACILFSCFLFSFHLVKLLSHLNPLFSVIPFSILFSNCACVWMCQLSCTVVEWISYISIYLWGWRHLHACLCPSNPVSFVHVLSSYHRPHMASQFTRGLQK